MENQPIIQGKGIGTPLYNNSTQDQLIVSAWAYNLKIGVPIHRFSLFSFVQTHLSNKSEENLQGTIEKCETYWESLGNGHYSLTRAGELELSKYGINNSSLKRSSSFLFNKKIDRTSISITVSPIIGKYIDLKVNGVVKKTIEVIDLISRHYHIPTSKTSLPRKIHNWILSDNNYEWKIQS